MAAAKKASFKKLREIDQYFQSISAEVDERVVQLCCSSQLTEDVIPVSEHHSPLNASVYAVRDAWKWNVDCAFCSNVHLRNAAQYHQFYWELRHYDECLSQLSCYIYEHQNEERSYPAAQLTDAIKGALQQLLEIEGKLEELLTLSKDIIPVHLRTPQPAHQPIKTIAIIDCNHTEITLHRNEECLLLDNTDVTKWKISNSRGEEGYVPSVVMLIPSPDRSAVIGAFSLRETLLASWKEILHTAQQQTRKLLLDHFSSNQPKQLHVLNPAQRGEVIKCIEDLTNMLDVRTAPDDPDKLQDMAQDWQEKLHQLKGTAADRRGESRSLQAEWTAYRVLQKQLMDFEVFAQAYQENVDKKHESQSLMVWENKADVRYVSRAYIERLPENQKHEDDVDAAPVVAYKHCLTLAEKLPLTPESLNTTLNSTMSEELISQMSKETQTYVIKGVIDPRDDEEISIYDAINEGIINQTSGVYVNPDTGHTMPIPEAMNRGYILVEFTDTQVEMGELVKTGVIRSRTSAVSTSYSLKSAVDPVSGQKISISAALEKGIIEQEKGLYMNPLTGDSMPIMTAIEKGLLEAEVVGDEVSEDKIDALSAPPVSSTPVNSDDSQTLSIVGVRDPNTGRLLTPDEAVQQGLLDLDEGYFVLPSGENIPLEEAVKRGLLLVKLTPVDEADQMNRPRTFKVLTNQLEEISEMILDDSVDAPIVADVNLSVFQKLKPELKLETSGFHDLAHGEELSIKEAVEEGVVYFDTLQVSDSSGHKLPLQHAAIQGLVEPSTAKHILTAISPHSLQKLIDSGKLDPKTGCYVDDNQNQSLPLNQAILSNLIDPDLVFFRDLNTQAVISLSAAIEEGKFDPRSGKMVDPITGKHMSLDDAITNGLINPEVDADKIASQISAIKFLNSFLDTSEKGIKNASTGELLTLEEAVMDGILDIPHAAYVNVSTQEKYPFSRAVEEDLMDPKTAREILVAMNGQSLGEMVKQDCIDPNTGKYIDPVTRKRLSMKDAIEQGLLDPASVFFVDPATGEVNSLDSFIEKGMFNPATGKFKDPLTGLETSIFRAIKNGVIEPNIDHESLIPEKSPLKDLMSANSLDPQETLFVAPDGSKIPLKDAMSIGLVYPQSMVKLDPHTKAVLPVENEDIITALSNTKKNSDWLTEIESSLAEQRTPAEQLNELSQQLSDLEGLQKSVENHLPSIAKTQEQSRQILASNKGQTAGSDPSAQQQQINRLRYGSSDNDVRLQAVKAHMNDREGHLRVMTSDLNEFYGKMEDFDVWMSTALEEMKMFEESAAEGDINEVVKRSFEDFTEGVLAKEDDLLKLHKLGDKVKSSAKECEKSSADFRSRLYQGSDQPEVPPQCAVIDSELTRAADAHKKIQAGCTALMAKLSDIAAKNQLYKELKAALEESLPALKQKVDECDDEVGVTGNPKVQLQVIKDVTADVVSQGKLVEDLDKLGNDLVGIFDDLDSKDTPRAQEILATIAEVNELYDTIQEAVVDKQHKLNDLVARSQDVGHNLNAQLQWVVEMEETFNNMLPVSLDRDKLNSQIQHHRVLSNDIESHQPQVDSVVEQCQTQGVPEDQTGELLDRFDDLITRSEARGNEVEEVVEKLGTLHSNVHQLETWLTNSVNSLKRESNDFDTKAIKAKIENLYKQKQIKEKDLHQIKAIGKELIEAPNTGDKNRLKETLADIQGKWHDLTELLVQMISFAALREIDDLLKYLDKAENEIRTAEPLSTDPETLAVQVRDHKAFHEDLENKRRAVNDTIVKCNLMLRETTNEEADDIKNKLDTIRNQADLVCKLSSDRLAVLEEALPLASHFSETHADLQSWLNEIDAEVESLDCPAEGNAEQVKKQQDNAKSTQRLIEDHKPLVEDLISTGHDLADICTDDDRAIIKQDTEDVAAKFDKVKTAVREKLNQLDDAFRSVSSDVGDSVDSLVEELHYLYDQIQYADPIAANPDILHEQIIENNTVSEDLMRKEAALIGAREAVARVLETESPETAEECEDLRSKLQDLEKLEAQIRNGTTERGAALEKALVVADKFRKDFQDAIVGLRDIQDNLVSQDSPGVDPSTIREQLKELETIQSGLELTDQPVKDCCQTASQLAKLCGVPGNMEVEKHIEDVNNICEEIQDGLRERQEELQAALDKAEHYDSTVQSISHWLPRAEEKLRSMSPVAADPRSVRIQIEELKAFKVQTQPKYVDVQNLNQYASDLKNASPLTAESLTPQVKDFNERWNKLLKEQADRETTLKSALVELGELDHTVEDVLGTLGQAEYDLQQLDYVYGDPKHIEKHLKKVQMLQKDLSNQEPVIDKLCHAIDAVVERSGQNKSPLLEKREEMLEAFRSVQVTARDKQNQLQDTLKEVKAFMGEVEDYLWWMNDFRTHIKTASAMGALPDTAQKEFMKFMNQYNELEQKEGEIRALLINGEDMLARCREEDTLQLKENLTKLQQRTFETRDKAEKRRRKLEQHLQNVQDFHAMLKIHTDWLSKAEKILASFKYPSKLVDKITKQIQDHKDFKDDIDAHREIMQNLDRTGTYLKYFGRKQDTVYIKNLLISIKLRWKKLVRRTDEKGRLLQQAYKEDKRFYDAWKGLCDWLDENEKKMKRFAAGAKVKQDMDDLRHFQHQLSAKHPTYYSTMRLGRSLKDRCTKTDPERDELNSMLEQLKNKWSIIRTIAAQRQNKLDEMLLSSGRLSEALTSLLEWIQKAETYLAEDQPILGDIDTVTILIEQHKAFEQELSSRANMRDLLKASTTDPAVTAQLEDLSASWDSVCRASTLRQSRLQDAHKLAEEFNEAVRVVREWLPHAEAELKFRALPEDEESIIDLIEQHEKFQEDLRGQQPRIEKIRFLAEEILQSCHPNASRFVKYYLTITQTRWEQAINRSNQRHMRLQEALRNIRGNSALVEELLAWLTEAQALLTAKEQDPMPQDLTVAESLVKEHLEFHEDLANKNKDAEKLLKTTANGGKSSQSESPSHRVHALNNKWRSVWRMSVDRKKRLQDTLDHLMELESFKNFNFDQWRDRYNAWIRSEKLRITDFFRRQDKDGDGSLTRSEFVEGMLSSKFPTNRTEMNAVFDIFDRKKSGTLDYQEFVNALKHADRRVVRARPGKKSPTDNEIIHDEVEQEVSHCQCRHQFKSIRTGEGKYKFGEKGKLYLVRLVNSAVMVRVGGGWMALAEFLENNDPCRARGRTNMELREQYLLSDGFSNNHSDYNANRRPSTPTGKAPLNSSLSGSVTSLHEKTINPLASKHKQAPTARSWSNLGPSTASPALKLPKENPRHNAPRKSVPSEPISPIAHSSPRRSTLHTPTASSRSRQVTPKSSTPKMSRTRDITSNGSDTSSHISTASENRTPTSQRSRSPTGRPKKLTPSTNTRQHMKF